MNTNATVTKSNFLIQGSILAAAGIVVRLIGLFYKIPMTIALGDEGIGYYNTAYEIYNMGLILSSYSLPMAMSKLISGKLAKNRGRDARQLFISGLTLSLSAGLLMTLFIFLEAEWITTTLFQSPNSALPLKVMAPTIFVFSIMGVIRGYFQGHGNMVPTSISQIIEQIINALVSIVASINFMVIFADRDAPASFGAAGGTLGTLSGAIAGLITLVILLSIHKSRSKSLFPLKQSYRAERLLRSYQLLALTLTPIILSQFVYQLSGTVDNSMFGLLLSGKGFDESSRMELLGVYSGRYRLLSNVPVAIASSLGTSMIPAIAASVARNNRRECLHSTRLLIKFNMLIAIPSSIALGILAGPIMELVFRSPQPLATQLMQLGFLSVIFFSLSTVSNAVLQGIDLMRKSVTHSAISLVIHIILVYVMLEYMNLGVYGLVIGNVTFALVVCILNAYAIKKALRYRQEIKTTFIYPLVIALVACGIGRGLYELINLLLKNVTISLLITLPIIGLIYGFLIIYLNVVNQRELEQMPFGRRILRLKNRLK